MVHRPADSRLLSNLLQQEKVYLKHFNQLLNSSAASLDSFTAYAAASPPPASQVILAVTGLLAASDNALKRYATGIEQWRDAMRLLKDMEDDVGNIMRDREILVTRLIKVSKSHKSNSGTFRESLLIGPHQQFPSSSSSLSVGNYDSSSPSPSRPVSASFPTSIKLAAAQSELQACETHLASKESELASKRCAAVREGLSIRAKAMIECSWTWGQLGKQILHSLNGLGNVEVLTNEHEPSIPPDQRSHVPEDPTRPSSDFSSIAPSQSASQTNCDGQQPPESTNTNSRMLDQPMNGNTVDAKRLPVSAGPTLPRPNSVASTVPSSLSHTQAMPTTYKLETVTYAPAVALVVPSKDDFSSSPPPPILGYGSNAPVTGELSKDQYLHTRMRVPAAHAINEYDIPTTEVAGSQAETTAWRHLRGGAQEGSNQIGHSNPQPLRMPLVSSSSEQTSGFGPTLKSTIIPQRHNLERRITEEDLQGTSALIEVFDDPEHDNNEEEEEDELPVEDQLVQQGKLAVIENPRFMSEERKRELERERERERTKVAGVGQTPMQGQIQSQSDVGHVASIFTSAAPSTPQTSPLKTRDLPYISPSKTSPSKRFLGSLKGLFGVRQPQFPSQIQDSSPSPSRFGTRKQASPSRIRTMNDDSDADVDSDEDSPTKARGGLQALFRGDGAKKKSGSASGAGWSTRTDKNIRKLTKTRGLVDDHDGFVSQDVGKNGSGTPAVSRGYSSDTAATAVSGHVASPLMKKRLVKNGGPGPAAASAPAAKAAKATPTAATATPTRKTSVSKAPTHTNPDIPVNSSRQPHAQPQSHHQHPTSHFASSSGGAIVLAAGGTHPSGTLISHPGWDTQALPTAGGGLSRNNSLLSAVSAPTGSSSGVSGMSKTKKQKETVLGHGMGSGTGIGRRSSLGSSSGHAEVGAGPDGKGEKKKAPNVAPGGSSTGPVGSVVQPTQPAPSLMSIVEDVARHNREWSQESSQLLRNKNKIVVGLEKEKIGSVGMVDLVRAPPRIGREELARLDPTTIKGRVMEMNPVPGVVTSAAAATTAGSNKRPTKPPLRSAMKSSRTPSPSPGPVLVPHLQKRQQQPYDSASQRRKDKANKNNAATSQEVVGSSGNAGDGDSASTNDTGDEVFYTDDEDHQIEAQVVSSANNQAVHRAPPMPNGHAVGYARSDQVVGGPSEHTNSTTSTAVAHHPLPAPIFSASQPTTPPQRRKSVRVSLQPTFSPSPPAIEDDDEEEQKYHAPWAWEQGHHGDGGLHVHAPVPLAATSPLLKSSYQQKVVGPEQTARVHDIWEDSSDEDVEYQKAKRHLMRAARKEEDMNVFVAGRSRL